MRDKFKLKGTVRLKIYENGVLIDEHVGSNLVVDRGYEMLFQRIVTNTAVTIDMVGVGSDGTAPASDNTDLATPFMKTITSITLITPTSFKCDFTIGSGDANGITIQEFGLFMFGMLFARKTGINIAKNPTISISGEWTIEI